MPATLSVRFGIGPAGEQQAHQRHVAALGGEDERGLAAAVGEVDAGAAREQLLDALEPADLRGEGQRRVAAIALDVGAGALAEQEGQPGEVAAAHR